MMSHVACHMSTEVGEKTNFLALELKRSELLKRKRRSVLVAARAPQTQAAVQDKQTPNNALWISSGGLQPVRT